MKTFLIAFAVMFTNITLGQKNIGIEKSPNFRTYNGLKNSEGKRFRENVLFRSGSITALPSSDKLKIHDLKLTTIVDFRTDFEVQREPDDTAGLKVNSVRIPLGNINQQSSIQMFALLNSPNSTEATADSMMMSFYQNFASMVKSYKSFFEILLIPDSKVLFHCSAGKDRTGIASALLLKALDFDDQDIMSDFLRSNEAVGAVDVQKMKMYGIPEKMGSILMGVKSTYLTEAISRINKEYGSLDKMLESELGIGNKQKQLLKDKYLQ